MEALIVKAFKKWCRANACKRPTREDAMVFYLSLHGPGERMDRDGWSEVLKALLHHQMVP